MSLARCGAEHPCNASRVAQTAAGCLLPDRLGDVTEEVLAQRAISEDLILLAQGDVDDVVGGNRRRPVLHDDGTRELEERAQAERIDGDHAVDRRAAGLRIQIGDEATHGREVG